MLCQLAHAVMTLAWYLAADPPHGGQSTHSVLGGGGAAGATAQGPENSKAALDALADPLGQGELAQAL